MQQINQSAKCLRKHSQKIEQLCGVLSSQFFPLSQLPSTRNAEESIFWVKDDISTNFEDMTRIGTTPLTGDRALKHGHSELGNFTHTFIPLFRVIYSQGNCRG